MTWDFQVLSTETPSKIILYQWWNFAEMVLAKLEEKMVLIRFDIYVLACYDSSKRDKPCQANFFFYRFFCAKISPMKFYHTSETNDDLEREANMLMQVRLLALACETNVQFWWSNHEVSLKNDILILWRLTPIFS